MTNDYIMAGKESDQQGAYNRSLPDADRLFSELAALKLKLEKAMEHDSKAQEQARLRKEIFLMKLWKSRQHNLEDSSRMKDEALQLCQKWKAHKVNDSIEFDRNASNFQDPNTARLDSTTASSTENVEGMMENQRDDYLHHLKAATDIMADVQAKYENEETWLRQRMEQLRKEAEEIEQFKERLEKGRLLWELSMNQELTSDQLYKSMDDSNLGDYDESYDQYLEDEDLAMQLMDISRGDRPNFNNSLWSFIDPMTAAVHPAMRAVDQMPSLMEQLDEWNESNLPYMDQNLLDARDNLEEEVVLNVSLAAAEVDFFCDCNLRETIIPMLLHAETANYASELDSRPSRTVEIENEFLWKLTTSRQASERGESSTASSRRPSNTLAEDETLKNHVRNPELEFEKLEREKPGNLKLEKPENLKLEKPENLKLEKPGNLKLELENPQETQQKKLRNAKSDEFQQVIEELNGGPLVYRSSQSVNGDTHKWRRFAKENWNKRTLDTVGTSGSSVAQKQKRTLAETVRATQQLRNQLSEIVSTYDREVTYLLLSVENYRQQWKKEHMETQKQLHELRKSFKHVQSDLHQASCASSMVETHSKAKSANEQKQSKKLRSQESTKCETKLKQYNPDFELAIGKEKLSELNRQLIELHMKLNHGDSADYDKEVVRGMVNQILKQILTLRLDTNANPAFLDALQHSVTVATSRESSKERLMSNGTTESTRTNLDLPYGSIDCDRNKEANIERKTNRNENENARISLRQSPNTNDNVTYIVPERPVQRRSRSIEDMSDLRKYIERNEQRNDGRIDGAQKTKVMERKVISVSCEKKRSKSFEASYGRNVKVHDTVSIHEWLPTDRPRYVNEGDHKSSALLKHDHEIESKVQLSTKHQHERKSAWNRSPIPESSIDSGIGLHTDADTNGKQHIKEFMQVGPLEVDTSQPALPGCDSDFKDCDIHLHRYSLNGPNEFCRRSSTSSRKKPEGTPTRSVSAKSDAFSMRTRSPSPTKMKKPIEMTNVGDAVLAMGIELAAIVMSPSDRWSSIARSVSDTSFTDKFKRAINYHRRLQSRSGSMFPADELPHRNALLPPKYGRRTVSEQRVQRPPLAYLEAMDEESPATSAFSTITGKKKSSGKAKDHATHRTQSEADVFAVKKKRGLRWNDGCWTPGNK